MSKKKVLIVDDDLYIRRIIETNLKQTFEVITAVDGEEGLEKAMANPPDLAVIDFMMPKKDGLSLCRELKSNVNTFHIPIILLTAMDESFVKEEMEEIGIECHISKPFSPKGLLKTICAILNIEPEIS